MKNKALQPITFPLLTDANEGERADGVIGFRISTNDTKVEQIRQIGPNEPLTLRGHERALYDVAVRLREAISLPDVQGLKRAIEAVARWTIPPGARLVIPPGADKDSLLKQARFERSFLMNLALADVRVVVWSPLRGERKFLPGLYCPNALTAAFARMMIDRTGTSKRICANPECAVPFVPSSPRQLYHLPSCGNLTRVRRNRVKAKALAH
jgi:hypothetical protein